MNDKKYSMIISDFDGTLLRSDYTIDPETVSAIQDFRNRGGIFVLSSGRGIQAVLPIARELGLKGLLSGFNGSVIVDIETGKPILINQFSYELSMEICEVLAELGMYTQFYQFDRFFANQRCAFLDFYENLCKVKAIVPEGDFLTFVKENKLEAIKILSIMDEEKRDEYIEKVAQRLGDKCYVTSGGRNLIEICVKGFSKGTAVKFLSEHYKVPLSDVIAVGDSPNDLSMLKTAGFGIAVKNAEETLKKEVFAYGYSNDENAVGRIIEEYGIK